MQLKACITLLAFYLLPLISPSLLAQDHELTLIVVSHDNKSWYRKNLDSIIQQDYKNFNVIYIDDGSSDGTGNLVSTYIQEKNLENKITLIGRQTQSGMLANFYQVIHTCPDNAIIFMIDGSDWLYDNQALTRINQAYNNQNVWLTYGQYVEHPSQNHGCARSFPKTVIQERWYREYDWTTCAARTFYAWLFKQIKLTDLLYRNHFFIAAWDFACIFPMLEMAGDHCQFIPEVLYVCNKDLPAPDARMVLEQMHCEKLTRSYENYRPLITQPKRLSNNPQAAALIFSDTPEQLENLLVSLQKYARGISTLVVLYKKQDNDDRYEYKCKLHNAKAAPYNAHQDIATTILAQLSSLVEDHILMIRDTHSLVSPVDITECIRALTSTHAYGFYGSLNTQETVNTFLTRPQKMPPFINLPNRVCVWQFANGEYAWRTAHSLNFTLYRKTDCIDTIQASSGHDFHSFERSWQSIRIANDALGLCYEQATALPISRNNNSILAANLALNNLG